MTNQALYLKWRPQQFDDVIGQEHIITSLQNALRQGRVRHAYLFSGPRGTGKTTLARLLAKAVNCTHADPDQRPCNECHNCRALAEGRFMDLIEIDAASHTGVDDVRDLRDKIAFSPTEGQYKVYIVDEVHRFSGAAFDALLKTLEEPPKHAIFVLATTEIDRVPATIKSRCLLFEFRRVPLRDVVARLQMIADDDGINIDPAALELIARQGTGSVRDSISLLDQVVADPDEHITLELAQHMLGAVNNELVQNIIQALIEQDAGAGLQALNEIIDQGADPRQLGQQIVDHLRQVLLVQVSGADLVDVSDEQRALLQYQAQQVERTNLLRMIRSFNSAMQELRGGWQPQLPLELAIIEGSSAPPPPPPANYPPPPAGGQAPPKPKRPPSAPSKPSGGAFESFQGKPVPRVKGNPEDEVNLEVIVEHWGDFREAVGKVRTTFPRLLMECDLHSFEDNLLVISVRSEFILEKLSNLHNFEFFVDILRYYFKQPLRAQFIIGAIDSGDDTQQDVDPDFDRALVSLDPFDYDYDSDES